MSRNVKLALAILATLFICCVCASAALFLGLRSAGLAIVTEPADLAAMAAGIATYDLPPGYDEIFGMRFFGFEVVAIGSPVQSSQPLIMLMNIPTGTGLGRAQLEQQMQQALRQQSGLQNLELVEVGQMTVVIRDQAVTLAVQEGTDADGVAFRQLSGIFEGRSGPALLMIQGPQQGWEQDLVDRFLASLR